MEDAELSAAGKEKAEAAAINTSAAESAQQRSKSSVPAHICWKAAVVVQYNCHH